MAEENKLRRELDVFERNRKAWLQAHAGDFVVIQDDVIEGFYRDYADAVRAGLRRFGAQREFLVKQIWQTEPVYVVS